MNFPIKRKLSSQIQMGLKQFPVCAVLGSRQVGKTTLAKKLAQDSIENMELHYQQSIHLDLENPADLNRLTDPQIYLEKHQGKLIVIDEVQRRPDLFPLLRYLVDQGQYKFLLLGSSSSELIRHSSESLAGRMITIELPPFSLDEVLTDKKENLNQKKILERLWLRGGYPLSYLAQNEEQSYTWRGAFTQAYLDRDLPQLGVNIAAPMIRRFWQMIAHFHGQIWNASKVAQSMDISGPTCKRYLDLMEQSHILRILPSYSVNLKKRLIKAPKVYFLDSGLLHHALDLMSLEALMGHPGLGASWEGFAIEQIIRRAGVNSPHSRFYYYRTVGGAEVDLVEIRPDSAPILYEMKFSLSPKPGRGLRSAMDDLRPQEVYLVYPGTESYSFEKSISILSLFE